MAQKSEQVGDTEEEFKTNQTPTAEVMLERLNNINIADLDVITNMDLLKGKWNWLFILTMPISAIFLVSVTLFGLFIGDNFIISFVIGALIIYAIAKVIEGYEQQFKIQARHNIMQKIAMIESDFGLIHHFKDFLPVKYRHLWQSVRNKNFMYIAQYSIAIKLLQNKLDHKKFSDLWLLKNPISDLEASD